jgi:polyhydroxyalkanoate synthesis regulator phasin
MAERASSSERGPIETLTLAGFGALALAAQRADELADELASRVGVERGDMRDALADTLASWRREAGRIGATTGDAAWQLAEDLGVATRESVRELELRVAQLEHRLKLLEREDA